MQTNEEALTRTIILGQRGPKNNDSGEVLHISESSRTGTSSSNSLVSYPGYTLEWVLPFCGGAGGIFYSLSRQNG